MLDSAFYVQFRLVVTTDLQTLPDRKSYDIFTLNRPMMISIHHHLDINLFRVVDLFIPTLYEALSTMQN